MFWFIVILIIVLAVLYVKGVFRKEANCAHCGKTLKGTEQKVFRPEHEADFVLCSECCGKIHSQLLDYAFSHWTYSDYRAYLEWDDATCEERAQFNPTVVYGQGTKLKIDTDRCLFTIGSGYNDIVYRFMDVNVYEMNFKPEEIKEGVISSKVMGDEFITVELFNPVMSIDATLTRGASYRLREKGFISKKYEYDFSDKFMNAIMAFNACIYIVDQLRYGNYSQEDQSAGATPSEMDDVQKALALFMFDNVDEITQDSLKKQRNALIKAFHPDNNEANESYSQKINTAYDLLSKYAK